MLWENWLSVKIINMSRNGNLLKSKMKMGMEMSRLGCTGSQINDLKCIFIIWIYLLYLILRNFYSCYNTHGTATWIGLHFSLKGDLWSNVVHSQSKTEVLHTERLWNSTFVCRNTRSKCSLSQKVV